LVNAELLRGRYDARDYTSDEPLSFKALAEIWLEGRKTEVRAIRNLNNHIIYAVNFFAETNIKSIRYTELEDFLQSLPQTLSPKTKANIFGTLHSFWQWIVNREQDKPYPITMPKFPKLPKYKPTMRKIVTPENQARILTKLKEISPAKVYTAVLWCITYCLRFEEIRQVKVKDLNNGYMRVWDWKQTHYKEKKLLPEDWDIVKEEKAFGNEWFFRHPNGRQFGKDYLSECIKKAARALGFYDVVPYAIIKHSTITALSDHYSPEEIKKYFSLHFSPALYNYLHLKEEKKAGMYAKARGKIGEIERVKSI